MSKKILLTGFEPFLNYKINATLEVMKALHGMEIGEYEIVGRGLVVDFNKSEQQFMQYIEEVEPDIIISLGIAAGRHRVTPEQIAINLKDGDKDNAGYEAQNEKIDENGKDGIFTNLPIRSMVERLQNEGYPSEVSYSAGTYLCNNIMYRGMQYAEKNSHVLAGFIHIPISFDLAIEHKNLPGWPIEALVRAIEICIEEAVKSVS